MPDVDEVRRRVHRHNFRVAVLVEVAQRHVTGGETGVDELRAVVVVERRGSHYLEETIAGDVGEDSRARASDGELGGAIGAVEYRAACQHFWGAIVIDVTDARHEATSGRRHPELGTVSVQCPRASVLGAHDDLVARLTVDVATG